ncbi:MAG: B12-binding domain-containing radical SAM protein [Sandaracinaceae bacterium]|nr:B12-binding domain-containing radical SAM protein [Sandaracinaceae bacterium]
MAKHREALRAEVRKRVSEEVGPPPLSASERIALIYPSPYHVGMSSLGFLQIHRLINDSGRAADRAFLPDDPSDYYRTRTPLFTYELERPVGDYPILAISVAYELEIAGVIQVLELSGVPPLARDRDHRHPLVVMGGPLTFSNPLPLAPYADVILMGECDETIHTFLDIAFEHFARGKRGARERCVDELAKGIASAFVPTLHGNHLPPLEQADNSLLPAYSAIRTPHTELSNMFLIEAERGCSRGCTYCVMRRSTNGGMRLVPKERILGLIPEDAKRVGLVGAAVSDHPKIAEIVETLAERGCEVGLSSLRADRLNDRFVAALKRAGYRTLTTASDGASQRIRDAIDRKTQEKHLRRAAELVRDHGLERLKLYMMLGLPMEKDEDIDELIAFSLELASIAPLSLSIAPFVSKRNTPLDRQPFAGIDVVERRLDRLRKGVGHKVEIRSTSARWAWVEYVLAQGGRAEGEAVLQAVRHGGSFAAWKRAFEGLQKGPRPMVRLPVLA